jgi:hypothetical protein
MSYTPATSLPTLTAFQWSTKSAPNPTLSAPLSPTDTTIYFSSPPYDHTGAIITGGFLLGVRNADSYVMTCYIAPGAVAVDGLSATVVQGIRLEGLDFTTSDTTLIPAEGFNAGDSIFCNISGVIQALSVGAIRGVLATNGLGFIIGDGTATNATISHKDATGTLGFLRKNPTTTKVQYSNDGTNWVNIDSVSASNLVTVSATDTTPGYLETKVLGGTNITVTKHLTGGNEHLDISTSLPVGISVPATYSPAYMSGIDATRESNYLLWGGIADGSFRVTIDGVVRNITGINTVGTTSLADIASRIQTRIRAITGGLERFEWVTFTTQFWMMSGLTTSSSALTETSATGAGTDISGAGAFGGIGLSVGHVGITPASLFQAADAGKIALLNGSGRVDALLSTLPNTVTASYLEINKLTGTAATVTAANLNTMTASATSDAATLHTHSNLVGISTTGTGSANFGGGIPAATVIAHGLGRAVKRIEIQAIGSENTLVWSHGWVNSAGTNNCHSAISTGGTLSTNFVAKAINIINNASTPDEGYGVIGTLDATNFTITWTRDGGNNYNGTINYSWIAEA